MPRISLSSSGTVALLLTVTAHAVLGATITQEKQSKYCGTDALLRSPLHFARTMLHYALHNRFQLFQRRTGTFFSVVDFSVGNATGHCGVGNQQVTQQLVPQTFVLVSAQDCRKTNYDVKAAYRA